VTLLNPKISVLMSVKNAELTVSTSIESILRQSYTNYEFLIIDDASTDNTHKILKKYEEKDSRIKIFQNRENQGLTKSLNILIGFITGEYIARQDSDDESMVDRLQMQYDYLVKKKLDACATRSISMQSNRIIPGLSFYISPRILVNFKNPMVHGTLLISRKVLEELDNYDERFYYSQDYKLIYDLLKRGYKFKIVDEVLYRLNTVDNISNKFKKEQSYYAKCVRKKFSPET
jgi:glycosyltransferase involved in cell wall biosynthesis